MSRQRFDSAGSGRESGLSMTPRQRAGAAAEDLAARFLEAHGLRVVARNFRCRLGEIDLIARDGATLVFVEVRLRRNRHYGGASASIDLLKQRRLVAAAGLYLARLRATPRCRFDAILLERLEAADVEWLRDVIAG